MLLASAMGKAPAHALMESLTRQALASGRHLRDVTLEAITRDAALAGLHDRLAPLFDIDRAAEPAARIALDQLETLDAEARRLQASPLPS